jgi:hypothetical protein
MRFRHRKRNGCTVVNATICILTQAPSLLNHAKLFVDQIVVNFFLTVRREIMKVRKCLNTSSFFKTDVHFEYVICTSIFQSWLHQKETASVPQRSTYIVQ